MSTRYEHIQDTVSLERTIEQTVVSDTVKITVQVQAIVDLGTSDGDLQTGIRAMLVNFIETDKWSISNVRRSKDMQNERVSLIAVARVPEAENKNLHNRAIEASTARMEIDQKITVDNSIPQRLIDAAAANMRKELAKLAAADAIEYDSLIPAVSNAMNSYRVSSIVFGDAGGAVFQNSVMMASTANNFRDAGPKGGSSASQALGNTQKYSMTARYTLARVVQIN